MPEVKLAPRYITDEAGRRIGVILTIREYEEILAALEARTAGGQREPSPLEDHPALDYIQYRIRTRNEGSV